jgi:mono/diheme cytochrome c family protein
MRFGHSLNSLQSHCQTVRNLNHCHFMNALMMTKSMKLAGLTLVLMVLSACEQPAPQTEQAAPESASQAAPADSVSSIDDAGNVAPFGMAARQPVPVPDAEPTAAAEPATATATAAASSGLFKIHCVACHGADAKGVPGLGLNLVESQLVASSSQDELAAFLRAGRAADSPDNVTKVPMPGFAWMSDADLDEVTGYLKSLQ